MTWHYRGVITDGKDHLNDTTSGNTEENDMAVMADNKTVMVVMRTDVRAHCLSLSSHTAAVLLTQRAPVGRLHVRHGQAALHSLRPLRRLRNIAIPSHLPRAPSR